jgi:hypothetical protein
MKFSREILVKLENKITDSSCQKDFWLWVKNITPSPVPLPIQFPWFVP